MAQKLTAEQERAVKDIYQYAAQMMKNGSSREAILAGLKSRGLDENAAAIVYDNLEKVRREARGNRANRDMLVGGLFCIGGLLVTILSYSAVSKTGGSYVIAWGAVIFGGIQFFRGLASRGN